MCVSKLTNHHLKDLTPCVRVMDSITIVFIHMNATEAKGVSVVLDEVSVAIFFIAGLVDVLANEWQCCIATRTPQ